MQLLRWFMIAVSWSLVFHDGRGGTAPDLLVWDQESRVMHRKVDIRVIVDLASLPGPPGFLGGPWVQVHGGSITQCQCTLQAYFLSKVTALAGWI